MFVCLSQTAISLLFPQTVSTNLIKNLYNSVSVAVGLLVSTVTNTHTALRDAH